MGPEEQRGNLFLLRGNSAKKNLVWFYRERERETYGQENPPQKMKEKKKQVEEMSKERAWKRILSRERKRTLNLFR